MSRRNGFCTVVLTIGLAMLIVGVTADKAVARAPERASMLDDGFWGWLSEWGGLVFGGSNSSDNGNDNSEDDGDNGGDNGDNGGGNADNGGGNGPGDSTGPDDPGDDDDDDFPFDMYWWP